jgi:GTP-binding protein EngB required for normal cell division
MRYPRLLRLLLALGISLLFFLVLLAILVTTRTAFEVWDHLRAAPVWIGVGYGVGIAFLAGASGWLVWRLLRPPPKAGETARPRPAPPPNEETLLHRVESAEQLGADVRGVRSELARLRQRRAAGSIHVSLFGEISSGKSSLVRALIPEAEVHWDVLGGTTRLVTEYRWRSASGDELVLVDVPGTNEVGLELDEVASAEAQRAHVVLYVCDGDLSRSQFAELRCLLELDKPCILALNKTDRYSQAELELLKTRLRDRLAGYPRAELVGVQAGGTQEVLRLLPDGREEWVSRPIPPDVEELRLALQRRIDDDPVLLDRLRDSAVFSLIMGRLEQAETAERRRRADELVAGYSRKAVFGALAAVTPGSDLIIQGYLGVSLVKDLSALYNVPVRKVDRDRLLEMVQQHVGRVWTLTLAVAGNALKAFPGVGTLAGGVLHAVAYGLIFHSLGRAVARSFETRGTLHPVQTAQTFKETLGEELEVAAQDFAQMAIQIARQRKDEHTGRGR